MMKLLLAGLLLFLPLTASADVKINEENFPDYMFRGYLCELFEEYVETGVIPDEGIAKIKVIDLRDYYGIHNLKGIEYFTALTRLYCSNNELTSLDLSKNTALTYLDCSYNQLTSLSVSATVTNLICNNNMLTSLDVFGCMALTELVCFENQIYGEAMDVLISSLPDLTQNSQMGALRICDVVSETEGNECMKSQVDAIHAKNWMAYYTTNEGYSWQEYTGKEYVEISEENFPDYYFRKYLLMNYAENGIFMDVSLISSLELFGLQIESLQGIEFFTALKKLSCYENPLVSLDISKNAALEYLYCGGLFTSLDLSKNDALKELSCYNNSLVSLNLSGCKALESLNCSGNQLILLDLSGCDELRALHCDGNQLTSLNTSDCKALELLECNNNQLTTLDVSGCKKLETLYCHNNLLTTLDVSTNEKLTNIHCYQNRMKGAGMDAFIASLPMTFGDVFIYTTRGFDGNVCYKSQVAAIKKKYWTPYYNAPNESDWVIHDVIIEYEGEEEPNGGIVINEENFPAEQFRNYLVNTVYGRDDIITEEEFTGITKLDLHAMEINDLKGLEHFTSLNTLYCYENQISGAEMDALVNALPDRTQMYEGILIVYNSVSEIEGNVCTKSQVASIRAKNWKVYSTEGEIGLWGLFVENYEGYDDGEDAINDVQAEEDRDAAVYNLSGLRVMQQKKGEIYIKKGRKVLQR